MAAAGGRRGLWSRLKETRIGRWCRALLQDYSSATRETVADIRCHPIASSAALAAVAATAAIISAVPTSESFESATVEAAVSLLLLSPSTRSPSADRHVQHLLQRREAGRLRYQHLGIAAVIYEAPHHHEAALYAARCHHLQPRWRELPGRLLDIGFCGRWWVLAAHLRHQDVNEEEFARLPPRLQRIERHHLHSEQNERLFLEKFQPVVLSDEEIRKAESEEVATTTPG